MKDFEGKVAVITGAASGIGRALTEKCLAEGMNVVMADVEEAALNKAAEELQASGSNNVLAIQTDVAILNEIENLAQKAIDHFGAVHLLFNNAGVGGGAGKTWECTQKDWEWVLGVNLWSVIHGVQVFTPHMIAQDTECHIINTASVAGLIGGSTTAPYSVTKFGVVAYTENLFNDLATENLKVSTSVLCPGFINTKIYDSGRNRPSTLSNNDEQPSAEQLTNRKAFADFLKQGMQPSELADIVFDGIREKRLYILTHDSFNDMISNRTQNIVTGTNPGPVRLMGD